ncbi:MAG: methionyl-tRNA formyltransferase [Dehalococcoidia bacterium]|jgi:methionyl-tRNA formyltransferase
MVTMKTVFMGSPDFALPALQSLMSNKYDIRMVYTQPDKRTGRGQQVMSCAVKKFAAANGLNVAQPESLRDANVLAELSNIRPDIIVVAAYGQILPETILRIPKYKCINIHPSLLPKYRGPSPIAAAILNGDAETGVTIMLIEKKVDSGPILRQRRTAISDADDAESLSGKLAALGAGLLIETLPDWIAGKIEPVEQDDSLAGYTGMETKEDGRLDLNLPAVQLWRKVRAYHPWPGCYVLWKGGRLKIIKAIPVNDGVHSEIGQIIALPHVQTARLAVQTGDGLLGLITVQPEGKREMAAAEFIAGHRDFIGGFLT